ncbi:hypothetical protein VIGAN_11060900 [Vigna angularis var. angularis]|uniref:Uncharacterized protein n=1 Tax=Vigna angularis var. angularis TaxID=157739 RepID=A0A0S3T7Z7_PHAAN|nr:hypothetical protein VIGAN_11060900 [Vigna angularis var. angularis]
MKKVSAPIETSIKLTNGHHVNLTKITLTGKGIIRYVKSKGSPAHFSITTTSPPSSPDRMAPPASFSPSSATVAASAVVTDVVFVEIRFLDQHRLLWQLARHLLRP